MGRRRAAVAARVLAPGPRRVAPTTSLCLVAALAGFAGSAESVGGRGGADGAADVNSTHQRTLMRMKTSEVGPTRDPIQGGDGGHDIGTDAPVPVSNSSNASCAAVASCKAAANCSDCLVAVAGLAGVTEASFAATRATERLFLRALQATPACSASSTPPGLLGAALREMQAAADGCGVAQAVACSVAEFACFSNESCLACCNKLFAAPSGSAAVLGSAACRSTPPRLLQGLQKNCIAFPQCTFSKRVCRNTMACGECLDTLSATGDGKRVAAECSAGTPRLLLDDVVSYCVAGNTPSCDYWLARCSADAACGACFSAMDNASATRAIVSGSSSAACDAARADVPALAILNNVFMACPSSVVTTCRADVGLCVLGDAVCAACLNGSVPDPAADPRCQPFLNGTKFAVATACAPCPSSVSESNRIAMATSVVGGVSVLACFAVIGDIVAHDRDRVSMRDRIILGLMLANAAYSSANAVPINYLRDDAITCGELALSFESVRVGRAWWFLGKFALVSFELFVLGASLQALSQGSRAVRPTTEVLMHVLCVSVGVAAFVAFFVVCGAINRSGYNAATQHGALSDAYDHSHETDDRDDDEVNVLASRRFESGRQRYDHLVQVMLGVWVGFLAVAVFVWVGLRIAYRRALASWREAATVAASQEAVDAWGATRRSAWESTRRVMSLQRDGYVEVGKPLELYVLVFFVFGAPAVVMSTDFCVAASGANSGDTELGWTLAVGATEFSYGSCFVWCELALSFRSLAAVAVYVVSSQSWRSFFDFRRTARLLWSRLKGASNDRPAYSQVQLGPMSATMVRNGSARSAALAHALPGADDWRIKEDNIRLVRRLAEGSFGVVWEAEWRAAEAPGQLPNVVRAAVKVMRELIDDEGDTLDPNAEAAFRNECAMMKQLAHPNLLTFFGAGVTTDGHRFIVTELAALGSLLGVLEDAQRELPWATRASIALQLALGMEYLHKVPIVHRDLKSANTLLDERLCAKVGDFGSSRKLRPVAPCAIVSFFTGSAKLVSADDNAMVHALLRGSLEGRSHGAGSQDDDAANASAMEGLRQATSASLRPELLTVQVLEQGGTMTKAVGTLFWMAPEVFRGDAIYNSSVDVYSFGIICCEIATRQLPHNELFDLPYVDVFSRLTEKLQTGERMPIPDTLEADMPGFGAIMQRCWAGDPRDRPAFSAVVPELAAVLRDTRAAHVAGQQ